MEQQMKKKFDIALTIAKENIADANTKPICELEERYGMNLGQEYKLALCI